MQTALVYQLQRRVRTLREQVQRKDLHLDLLRRKLALQEDNSKVKTLLQGERDEAQLRVKKLMKQVDRLQLQLSEAKSQIRDLNAQLAEAADYKVIYKKKKLCTIYCRADYSFRAWQENRGTSEAANRIGGSAHEIQQEAHNAQRSNSDHWRNYRTGAQH